MACPLQINLISPRLPFSKLYFRLTQDLTINCHSGMHLFKCVDPWRFVLNIVLNTEEKVGRTLYFLTQSEEIGIKASNLTLLFI